MKTKLLLLLFPLAVAAQQPAGGNTGQNKDVPAEKTTTVASAPTGSARQRIEEMHQRVLDGEDMAVLARLYSEDPGSKRAGGVYNNVTKGMMVQEFEAVAFALKPSEISQVFETQYGYHFMQLIANHGETVDVRHILVKY